MTGPRTVTQMFTQAIASHGHWEAVVCRKGRKTYGELGARIRRMTQRFRELRMPERACMGVLSRNCHYSYEAAGMAALGGWVYVPLNYLLAEDELAHIIQVTGMHALVYQAEFEAVVRNLRRRCSDLDLLVTTGLAESSAYSYETMATAGSEAVVPAETDEDDTYCVLFTSGTSGDPKGVMLSHRNIVENALAHVREFEISDTSRGMVVNPHFFSGALNSTMIPILLAGATNVFQDGFSPKTFLETVERERITHVQLVPTMIFRLLDSAEWSRYHLSSLRTLSYGSAPMPVSRLEEALKAFGQILVQVYGMTEFTAFSTILRKEDHVLGGTAVQLRRVSSCGQPRMGAEVLIVDDRDRPVSAGTIGEVVMRGATVMQGYWRMSEESAQVLRNGWLHSGDMAWQDEDGYVYLIDRKKDIIITGGINISPLEVEQVLYTHPAVAEVVVVGVPDAQWGEAVKAVIVLRPKAKVSAAELVGYCTGRLAGYKKPKSVDFVEELPRGPTGKILRRIVRERYWLGRERKIN